MSRTVDELIAELFEGIQPGERYASFARQAEMEGYPQLAKILRAVVASERVRFNMFRQGIAAHASATSDYTVCPHCGLVFAGDAPEKCPVDDTTGARFERIR